MQAASMAPAITHSKTDASVLPDVLDHLDRYRHVKPTRNPRIVRRGGLKFDPVLETRRIELAEEIAKRVDPGPAEDPSRFAIIAYAAASIELGFPDELSQRLNQDWSRFLFGSVSSQEIQAGYGLIEATGMSIVYVSSALIDFLVQAAQIVVTATKAPALPGTTAREDFRPEAVNQRLDSDSTVVDRLYQVLKAYIYDGSPHAFQEKVNDPSNLPLGLLLSMANRWVIGHECGHRFAADLQKRFTMSGVQEEFFADLSAMVQTAYSATRLDGVPPELGAAGGAFFLACDDVLQRAISVAKTGEECAGAGDNTHPADESRAIAMVNAFYSILDVSYESGGISLSLRTEPRTLETASPGMRLLRTRVLGHARALFQIWDRARRLLLEDFRAGRQPHAIWKRV
jgi:hypothetical protein